MEEETAGEENYSSADNIITRTFTSTPNSTFAPTRLLFLMHFSPILQNYFDSTYFA
jgi:hypothetical protein